MDRFSFRRIADFPAPDLAASALPESVQRLERVRRRESLFATSDKASIEWNRQAAALAFDMGAYFESDRYSNRLGVAAREAKNDRILAEAYIWQCAGAVCVGDFSRLQKRLNQLSGLANSSGDPFVRAAHLFTTRVGYHRGFRWHPGVVAEISDDWSDLFIALREAASIFLSEGFPDFAIWCHIEYAHAKISYGEYMTSLEWIERALDLASEHDCWKWTGRMLQTAGDAATDQGYRGGVEHTLRRALAWADFVGDEWSRIECLITIGRLILFEMDPEDGCHAVEADGYFKQAEIAARALGSPYLRAKAEHGRRFVRHKSRVQLDEDGEVGPPVASEFQNHSDFEQVRRMASRLEDGIRDSPDPFLLFEAVRDEQSRCRDFINDYRNGSACKIVDRRPNAFVLFSEVAELPVFSGLWDLLMTATRDRKISEDVVSVEENGRTSWYRRRVLPSGDGAVVRLRESTSEVRASKALGEAIESARASEHALEGLIARFGQELKVPAESMLEIVRSLGETKLDQQQTEAVSAISLNAELLLKLVSALNPHKP